MKLAPMVVVATAMIVLSGCGDHAAKGIADQIIQKNLNSPGTYKVARQDVLWSKALADETAHIVRTEYDAQNGLGALLRDCQYTSFIRKGDQITFDPLNGMQPCTDSRDSVSWEADKIRIVNALIENARLKRFLGAADSGTEGLEAKARALPSPAALVEKPSVTIAPAQTRSESVSNIKAKGATHCASEEEVIFSCDIGKKTVSVCASIGLTASSGYLQYRFGPLGMAELKYPETSLRLRDVTSGGHLTYSGGGGAYIRFVNGDYAYVVYTGIGRGWEKQGVVVEKGGQVVSTLLCNGVYVSEIGSSFLARAGIPDDGRGFNIP